jgi:mannose-1-phosphate guanylyltransferase
VILAGGSGTRLWPASRRARPKQFLALGADGETLLAAAVRMGRSVAGDVVIVTAESQVEATRAAVSASAGGAVELIAEPVGRNTAAAIGLAAAILELRDPDAVLAVLPADQHVTDRDGLARVLDTALAAAERDDVIATIGITPTRAETGFGYLELAGAAISGVVAPVVRFVEKPDRATAEAYVASGRYLWNAGMFCATARRLLAELDAQLPATAAAVRDIARDASVAAQHYAALPSISIDHGVMEKATRVVTVPASVGWDDVGSWAAVPAVRGADAAGNTTAGATLVLDGTHNIVISDDATLIATVGVSDLVVVKSGDAIIVIPRERAQDVRAVIDALAARGLAKFL